MSELADEATRFRSWHKLYPGRWRHELAALRQTGWRFAVRYHAGTVSLRIDYPIRSTPPSGTGAEVVRLRVRFEESYPHFPPKVYEIGEKLRLRRHRSPDGLLCLIHDEDWTVGLTVADLLRSQMPKVLRTGQSPRRVAEEQAQAGGSGWEVPTPEPQTIHVPTAMGAIAVPETPVPIGVTQGALVVLYAFGPGRRLFGAGRVERVLGEGFDIGGDYSYSARATADFVTYGRWLRDDAFDPAQGPERAWRRIEPKLRPLFVEAPRGSASPVGLRPDLAETIGLLVPDEVGYGVRGENWIFLLRYTTPMPGGAREWHYEYRRAQYLSQAGIQARTPIAVELAKHDVAIVGLGSVGAQVATDLAKLGARLTVVDRDVVDIGTASRQTAPPAWAGYPKSFLLQAELAATMPSGGASDQIRAYYGDVGKVWDRGKSASAHMCRDLQRADLVVDATGNGAVTRFLAAFARQYDTDFLTVSATAGGYGGVVALLTNATGCWACVEHWRADHALPVPPADQHGWVATPRCSDLTFAGTGPDLATISHHASRIAIHRLAGDDLDGDYFVGAMRDAGGRPVPISWQAVPLPIHPACPLHGPSSARAA